MRVNKLLAWLLVAAISTSANAYAPRKKRTKRAKEAVITSAAPVPLRLDIAPDAPASTTINAAVGAVTTLIFDSEKVVNVTSGLREQLGVQTSDDKHPGNLVYLRPTLALAGLTTNVIIETTEGRMSFFVRTAYFERGAKPGDFNAEVYITTAGGATARQKLEAKIEALETQAERDAKAVKVAEDARESSERRATEARGEGEEKGRAEALAGMSKMPLKGKRGRVVNVSGCRLQQLARVEAEGATWLVYELKNTGKVSRRIDAVSVSGEGRALMHAPVGDVFPGKTARVGLWLKNVKAADSLVFHVTGATIKTGVA